VQACGDAHLSNFGDFASPERKFLFDVNDFDETLPGPWEWDVKRQPGRLACARGPVPGTESVPAQMTAHSRKVMAKDLTKAQTRDSLQAFSKLCGVMDGMTRIIADPPLIMPVSHLLPEEKDRLGFEAQLDGLIGKYRRSLDGAHQFLFQRYQLADLARKVVGVGSVGTRCWICLFTDPDGSDPLLLQVKEAQPLSPDSPLPTPTRMNATTPRSPPQPPPAASSLTAACDLAIMPELKPSSAGH
jgi:Uncharacterized protein conserved in bacteria (DUF2252)